MTPDERRATWVEPGLAKRLGEDGEVTAVSIDLRRVDIYDGNGMTFLPDRVGADACLVLSPAAIRRLYRIVEGSCDGDRPAERPAGG